MSQQAMKSLFCRISKVDEEKRTVTGIGASEAVDAENEIFDYESSKPYIEAWSAAAFARSKGKSYGNIREMHQLSAVGKLSDPVLFDDAQKLVILTAYISDDAAWKKCQDGTYTGFSIRGPVVGELWSDPNIPGAKRYTCSPIEFSVCDLPCNGEAVFTAVKAGGITEERKFKTAAAVEKEASVAETKQVAKSMYSIQDLVSVIASLRWTQDDLAYEAEYEGDNSPIPDKLKGLVAELCNVLVDLTREETSELVTAMKSCGSKVLSKQFAQKAGVKKAKKTPMEKLSKALDSMGECLGKACKCTDMAKCFGKMASAHADAMDAVSNIDTDEDSAAEKAAGTAAQAAPITTQGGSPEIEDEMDEATKAQIAAAEQNSAKALEIAQKTASGVETMTKAFEKLIESMAGEPVAAKSAGAGAALIETSKAEEMAGKQPEAAKGSDPTEVAKSILSRPREVTQQELAGLRIGR